MARFLVITNMYPPHHHGGYELACADVVRQWSGHGHKVAVLTTTTRLADVAEVAGEREGSGPAPVWRDLTWYWDDHRLRSPTPWRRFAEERANERVLRGALDRFRPDVVSVWAMGAVNIALLAGVVERRIPIVVNLGDEWLVYERYLDAWTRMWRRWPRLGRLVATATGVHASVPDLSTALHCFCSKLTLNHSLANPVWPVQRVEITPPGVDQNDFPPAHPTEAEDRARRPFGWRILYVGRLDERKGLSTVVRALPLLPPESTVSFLGRGDANYRAELERLVVELGVADRVAFGAVTRAELATHYADADVLVFPSEWEEPFGLVPLEGMACGTPVVATGVGGSAEFLADGVNSLFFQKGDPEALAAALRRLADDPDLRALLVSGGLRSADHFTSERMASQLESLHLAEARCVAPQSGGTT